MGEDDFRALVENAPDAIVVSRDGIVLYANAAAARLLGHDDVGGLVGKPMTFLDRRSVEVMRRRIEQMAVTGDRLVPREYPARRRDGTEIVAEIASTVIAFEGAPAILAYARDVTERSRLRAQLAHADRLASLGRMAAGVAHEINNPLTFVTLAAEVLTKRARPGDGALIDEIKTGAARIAAIVRDLRFFGRYDDEAAGPVDVGAALAAAERLVLHELTPRGVLVKDYGELPAVLGIARHIEQVFVNLLLNAAHALEETSAGRVVLRARATDAQVIVTVEDNGCGIPQEHLDRVFEPFFTTQAAKGGTGLGLSISRDMVVRGGGTLVARSTAGEGTTMEVTLPRLLAGDLSRPSPPPAEAPPARAPSPPPAPRASEGPGERRVLVVDDEALIVNALLDMLAEEAQVTCETTADAALRRILGEPPFDAIVCDVMMSGMSGAELHRKVALARPALAARFVFITGGVYTSRGRGYLDTVDCPRLEKPFGAEALRAAVARVATAAEPAPV